MAEDRVDNRRDARSTIFKSGLSGVAATALAVTIFSPAGFGGVIGTSVASSLNLDSTSTRTNGDPYSRLPAFPTPITPDELLTIQGQLASAQASMEITRAATDARVEQIRAIALTTNAVAIAPTLQAANEPELRLTLTEPVAVTASAPVEVTMTPVSYQPVEAVTYSNPHLELADLLLARDNF